MKDATFVGPRPLVSASNDYLSEKIACHLQGTQFLIRLVRASHVERALEIDALEPRIDDKVYFVRSSLAFPRGVFGNRLYYADIYSIPAPAKLAIYDILHEMRTFHLTEIEPRVSQPRVLGIVFDRRTKILPPLYIPPLGFLKKE